MALFWLPLVFKTVHQVQKQNFWSMTDMDSATNSSSSGQLTLTSNDFHSLMCEMVIIKKHLIEVSWQFNDGICVKSLEYLEYNRYPNKVSSSLTPVCICYFLHALSAETKMKIE